MEVFKETLTTKDGVSVSTEYYKTHTEALKALDERAKHLIKLLDPVRFYIGGRVLFEFETEKATIKLEVYGKN